MSHATLELLSGEGVCKNQLLALSY